MKGPHRNLSNRHILKTPAMCLTGLKSKLKFARKVENKEIPIVPEANELPDESKTDSTCKQDPTKISDSRTKTEANKRTEPNKKLSESSAKANETKTKMEVKITGAKSKQDVGQSSELGDDQGTKQEAKKTPATPKVSSGRIEARKIAKETANSGELSKEKKKMQKIGLGYPWKQLSSSKIHKRTSK